MTRPLGVLLAVLVACGGTDPAATLSSSWTPPSSLAFVPADTPYLAISLNGGTEQLDDLVYHQVGSSAAAWLAANQETPEQPLGRFLWQLAREVVGMSHEATWTALGLRPHGRFLVYGLGLWPVLRLEVADAAKTRAVFDRAMAGAGKPVTFGTATGWELVADSVGIAVAVTGDELVVTAAPARELPIVAQRAVTERAAHAMVASTIMDIARRHHLGTAYLLEIDTRAAVAQIATAIRASGHPDDAAVATDCVADAERLAALVPRYVIGYSRVDPEAIDGSFVIELAPELARGLDRLHVAMPKRAPGVDHPLGSFEIAVDVDAAVDWLRGAAALVAAQPLACKELHKLKDAAGELADKLANAIPPDWRGLHGSQVVIEDATMRPPGGIGYAVLYGAHVAAAINQLGPIPGVSGLPPPGAPPIQLPVAALGLPNVRAFFAIGLDRAVVAVGPDSQAGAQNRMSAGATEKVPLMTLSIDVDRLARQFPDIARKVRASLQGIARESLVVDVRDDSFVMDFHAEMTR